MSIPKASDPAYRSELAQTRRLLRSLEDISDCRQLGSSVGMENDGNFQSSCQYILSRLRENESSESNDCLLGLHLIRKNDEEEFLKTGKRFSFDSKISEHTSQAISQCLQQESISEKITNDESFVRTSMSSTMRKIMPQYTNRLREWKAANQGVMKSFETEDETTKVFEIFAIDAQNRLTSCLKKSGVTKQDEKHTLAMANYKCGGSFQELFYKGLMLACQRKLADCLGNPLIENEKVSNVLGCVNEIYDSGAECVKLAMSHIKKVSKE